MSMVAWPSPVHPHTRGDICSHHPAMRCAYGSPPHAWGHYGTNRFENYPMRFTPTRVGTFSDALPCRNIATVHPHTRGDIVIARATFSATSGSPPHAWGHFLQHDCILLRSRFTPTRVGTFHPWCGVCHESSVHPHTRGDIARAAVPVVFPYGSPPHAWGHYYDKRQGISHHRFTPTRVGTLISLSKLNMPPPVHPHTRGDIVNLA